MLIPESQPGDPNYLCVLPLVLLGIGYSVYAAALWGCIPYTVPARLIGTAYGLCTAVQNIGLTISPLISGVLLNTKREQGYFWLMMYFSFLACCGIVINLWLYVDDLKNHGGILDAVDNGEKIEEMMTTPVAKDRRKMQKDAMEGAEVDIDMNVDGDIKAQLDVYHSNKEARDNLKRSVAKQAMSNN